VKQKDILTIVVIVIVSVVFSVVVSNFVIKTPKNRQQSVEVVEPIGQEFVRPNNKFFNDKSINPTQKIQIGDSTNKNPIKQ
jgi:hypothetical protein